MYQSFDKNSLHGSLMTNGRLEYDRHRTVERERAKFDAQLHLRSAANTVDRQDGKHYELQYKKDMQGLSIDRRSMETSMLAYTERMKEITLQRSTQTLQPLVVKPQENRRWASLSILNRNHREGSKITPITSFPERSMSADETQNSFVTLERDSLPERPFSDTHNRMFNQLNDKQQRSKQDGQFFDQIRARMYHRRELGFNSLRKNMEKLPELKTHEEVREDAYMPTDDRRNISIEVFPFPSIELQAVPAVLHRNPKTEKQKKRKKKGSVSSGNSEKKSYIYRPPIKTHKRGKVKIKSHSKSKMNKSNHSGETTAHKVIPESTRLSPDKPKRKLNVRYLDVVKDALRDAVEEFEGDLDTVLKNEVINIPELKAEIKRIRVESIKKKKAQGSEDVLKNPLRKPDDNSRTVKMKVDKHNSDSDTSTREESVPSVQTIVHDESVNLKSVLKKEVDETSAVKPKRKNVQFQLPELIRMITKLSEIHRQSPDLNENTDEMSDETYNSDDEEEEEEEVEEMFAEDNKSASDTESDSSENT